jgi:hypothetical protein
LEARGGEITISYRREDSGIIAGRIFDRLVEHYGTDTVFLLDIHNIPPGTDYRDYINEALSSTDVLLAVIGPDWAGKTPDGRIRIAEPTDLVRMEVEVALRKKIPVVPVLVAKATMPNPNELPEALRGLAYHHAIKADAFEDFDDHLRRFLMGNLDRLLQSAGVRPPRIEVRKGAEQDKAVGDVTALGAKQNDPQEAARAGRKAAEEYEATPKTLGGTAIVARQQEQQGKLWKALGCEVSMAEIFISYSHGDDGAITEKLADELEHRGYSVWWDTRLVPGEQFAHEIKKRVLQAKAVIVIWTPSSIGSVWVYDEARRAAKAKKLITLRVPEIDFDDIPMPFGGYQTGNVNDVPQVLARIASLGILPAPAGSRPNKLAETMTQPKSEAEVSTGRPPKLFISYRREDSAGYAGRVYDRLEREFGRGLLVMDVDSISLGANFIKVISEEVAKCAVLLAIIGPRWVDALDEDGKRRLENPDDFVRVELATALKRGIPVIPILLEGTRIPRATSSRMTLGS